VRTLVPVVVVVAVMSSSTQVCAADRAPAPQRSALSGLGVALAGLSVAGLGLGLAGTLIGSDASQTLRVYTNTPTGAPNQADAGIVSVFARRQSVGSGLAIGGFAAGAAFLVAGLVCLLLDAPRVAVAVVPGREGLTVSAQLQF
jgi:hypothetical protein